MMKTPILAAAVLALLTGPAFADHHRGGPRSLIKMLEQADANGDGAVTLAEIEAARADRFARMDANRDGGVDVEEAAAFRAERREDKVARSAGDFIAKRDKNNDGKVSAEEMDGGRLTQMFSRLDANSDGKIDMEELDQAAKRIGRRGGGDY